MERREAASEQQQRQRQRQPPGWGGVRPASPSSLKGQHLMETTSFCHSPEEECPGDIQHVDVWSNWEFLLPVAEEGEVGSISDGGELHRRMLEDEELFYEKLREAQQSSGRTGLIGYTREEALNLYALYKEVTRRGGLAQVVQNSKWGDVASALNWTMGVYFPLTLSYLDLLYQFEKMYFPVLGHVAAQLEDGGNFAEHKVAESMFAGPLCDADLSPTVKRKRRWRLASKDVFCIGTTITGSIINKFESGYVVMVRIGEKKLFGVLYHVEKCVTNQFGAASVQDHNPSMNFEHVEPNAKIDSSKQISDGQSSRSIKGDVDMPLGARTSYQIFIKEEVCRMKKQKLDLDNKGIWKMVLNSWRCLPKDDRLIYIEKSRKDKERYGREMAAYIERHDRNSSK